MHDLGQRINSWAANLVNEVGQLGPVRVHHRVQAEIQHSHRTILRGNFVSFFFNFSGN